MREIRFTGSQHHQRMVEELIANYPETIGKPLLDMAKRFGGELFCKVVFLKTNREPYIDHAAGAIVVDF